MTPGASCRLELLVVLLGGLLMVGCERRGTPPEVPAGRFTAYVEGSVSDTLRGVAHHRRTDGAITGLELGAEDGPGLSIDLEPLAPELRTYEVVEPELFRMDRTDSPPAVLAFLSLARAQFEATDGTLELTHVGEDRVGATFTFQMDGAFENGGRTDVAVEVRGELNASPTP